MQRKALIAAIVVAGYHDDTKTGTRLFVENRIKRADYDAAFNHGRQAKANGTPCTCFKCKSGE